jgi:hypothetical protein
MKTQISKITSKLLREVPRQCKQIARLGGTIFRKDSRTERANITEPLGKLLVDEGQATFVVVAGPSFDQNVPTAHVCIQLGYCHAFEKLGIPYIIVDVADLVHVLPQLNNPFCSIKGNDYESMERGTIKVLKEYPHFVWVDRWFKGIDAFFARHNLDPRMFSFSEGLKQKILESEPSFVYSATVQMGMTYYEGWQTSGMRVISLPLACDTLLYNLSTPYRPEFEGVRMAFVGGYWESKGRQIDRYLRPFEDDLVIYGYNKWPYKGYRGMLPREAEPSLYRQSLVCPTINEPTVRLFHGNINERIFKVMGSGGITVVDAVPAYRELFSEEELIIPEDEHQFYNVVCEFLNDKNLGQQYARRGYEAVISRHTYIHRAEVILRELGFDNILAELPPYVQVQDG